MLTPQILPSVKKFSVYPCQVYNRPIINELLFLADLRETEVTLSPVNMKPIISTACESLAPLFKEFEVTFNMPNRWPLGFGHASWVELVWANFINNAIQYGGRPPQIEVGATSQDDKTIQYWVKDNGPGLTEEEQKNLFVQFVQADQLYITDQQLSLWLVQQIITKLGGQIEVESEVGQGYKCYFTL